MSDAPDKPRLLVHRPALDRDHWLTPVLILLHTWRLRRIRWAMRTLDQRLAAYERAYGLPPFANVHTTTTT